MEKKVIVLAKDYTQFKEFMRSVSPEEAEKVMYVYGGEPNNMRGIRAHSVIEIGNVYEHPHYHELKEIALSRVI